MTDPTHQALADSDVLPAMKRFALDKRARAMFAATDGHWVKQIEAQSALDASRAECERLRGEKQDIALQALSDDGQWIEHTGKQQERIATLEAAVAALEVDARRYRWLLANYAFGDGFDLIDQALNDGEADEKLSDAIDNAVKAEGEAT